MVAWRNDGGFGDSFVYGGHRQDHFRKTPCAYFFLFGTVAPDLVSRVPSMALTQLGQWGLPVPPEWVHSFEPLHLPIGILLLAALVSLFFDAAQRWSVFVNFLGGMMLRI